MDSLDSDVNAGYSSLEPSLLLGLPFKPMAVSEDWFDWPSLPDLFPISFQGPETGRDAFLIDTDLSRLKARIADYFDRTLSHEEIGRRYPSVMKNTRRFDASAVRDVLLSRGGPNEDGFVLHAYRPFDNRWLYWEAETKLLREKSPRYPAHVFEGNLWLASAQHLRRSAEEPQACFARRIASRHLIERGTNMFPAWLRDDSESANRRPNLSGAAQRYIQKLGLGVDDLFHHVLATLHDPTYREANAGALRMEWPRIPLPADAAVLQESAAKGREIASLLDTEIAVPGVTSGTLRPELAAIAVPTKTDGRNMAGEDFTLTAGWGHRGTGDAVMPGQGRVTQRAFTPEERTAMGNTLPTLGDTTLDVHLNATTYWRNVPAAIWGYKLGGYQVLKKWLSYRERTIAGRPLLPAEAEHFTHTARRITALLLATS